MRVLEVGCGRGELLRKVRGFRVGVDIGLEYLQRFKGDYERVHATVEALPFRDGAFDVVIADSVLEHVLDLETCVKELSRVSDGALYALVPFKEDLRGYGASEKKYGLREHQRTFSNELQIPHFEAMKSEFLYPENYPIWLSMLVSKIHVVSILLADWLALHFWHRRPKLVMLEMRPNNVSGCKP